MTQWICILTGSTNILEYRRDSRRGFDIDFDDRTSTVIDNFHHLDPDPTTIYNKLESDNPSIEDQIVIPTSIQNTNLTIFIQRNRSSIGKNPLLMRVLRATTQFGFFILFLKANHQFTAASAYL
ncbi:hypothetical protein H4Q26_009978 [Puccinia striiformis f. sp. tritici PST-130]|nr:hypothetical protein H4Q26_009978 [Puccinia striiformis f. sp. tritici PST-130]